MANKFLFGFKETEALRNTPFEHITDDMGNAVVFSVRRWGERVGHEITVGDVIDNWNNIEEAGGRGMGAVKAKQIRAAFFAYLVAHEKSDSLKLYPYKNAEEEVCDDSEGKA